jgi:hypothetical protein
LGQSNAANVGNDRPGDSYIGICKKYLTAAVCRREMFRSS